MNLIVKNTTFDMESDNNIRIISSKEEGIVVLEVDFLYQVNTINGVNVGTIYSYISKK